MKLLALAFIPFSLAAMPLDVLPKFTQSSVYRPNCADISVSVHYFTAEDSNQYFGIDLVNQGYRPLLLCFQNKTDELYLFEPDSLRELILVPPKRVYELLSFNIWSYVSLTACSLCFKAPFAVPMAVMIPALVLHRYNQRLWENVQNNVLKPNRALAIHPGQTVKKLVFCLERSFSSIFSLELMNEKGDAATFSIDLVHEIRKTSGNPILPGLMVQ